MSIENAITTLAAALANIATAGDNIAGSINRYCELTEAQDRVMFEGFERDGKIKGSTETKADTIGDAIKQDRADAAEKRKEAMACEAYEAAENQKADDIKAKAKADAARMIADAAETLAAAKQQKAEVTETVAAKTSEGKTATYDEARAALIQGVSALGKEAVVAILHDNFNAKNIKELSDEQNAQLIGILATAIIDGDVPF